MNYKNYKSHKSTSQVTTAMCWVMHELFKVLTFENDGHVTLPFTTNYVNE